MITTPEQYQQHIHLLKSHNAPCYATLDTNEKPLEINLNTREIKAPEFLSVSEDYRSETIYFVVDRYYDYMDLAHVACVIQYINAVGKAGLYFVPFYDIYTLRDENKILFPWNISGLVTEAAGTVQFSIFFYSIAQKYVDGKYEYEYNYKLNTKETKSTILKGLTVSNLLDKGLKIDNFPPKTEEEIAGFLAIQQELQQIKNWQTHVYWDILD